MIDKSAIDNRPLNAKLDEVSAQRKAGFNYGGGWGPSPLPSIYFDAIKLQEGIRRHAHDASALSWEMEMAIRDIRLAESEVEKRNAVSRLNEMVDRAILLRSPAIALQSDVTALSLLLEKAAPTPQAGYNPKLGLAYIMGPIKTALRRLSQSITLSTLVRP